MSDKDLNIRAIFSEDGRHRLILRACWDTARPTLGFVGCNPSQAGRMDEALGYARGDPSVRKMAGFADRHGYGGLVLGNLWTYIETKPRDLIKAGYPNHCHSNFWLVKVAQESTSQVCCIWGANGRGQRRAQDALLILRDAGRQTMALKLTPDGVPYHLLYLPYELQMQPL